MNPNKSVTAMLFSLIIGATVGGISTYLLVRPDVAATSSTPDFSPQQGARSPSPVFLAIAPKAMATSFVPAPGKTTEMEAYERTDAILGIHQKYYAVVFDGGEVEPAVANLFDELTSKRLSEEIAMLNRFERDIPNLIGNAGGEVTLDTSRRGTHGDSIQTRYCFDYHCETAQGTVRVWILARKDQCTILVLVTEHVA